MRLDISYELSARQTIHMKCQVLFSLKVKKTPKNKMSSAAILHGTLRVKNIQSVTYVIKLNQAKRHHLNRHKCEMCKFRSVL